MRTGAPCGVDESGRLDRLEAEVARWRRETAVKDLPAAPHAEPRIRAAGAGTWFWTGERQSSSSAMLPGHCGGVSGHRLLVRSQFILCIAHPCRPVNFVCKRPAPKILVRAKEEQT